MDELHIRIWDYLYLLNRAASIATIAEQLDEPPEAIEMAVQSAWFTVSDGMIAIAYTN